MLCNEMNGIAFGNFLSDLWDFFWQELMMKILNLWTDFKIIGRCLTSEFIWFLWETTRAILMTGLSGMENL